MNALPRNLVAVESAPPPVMPAAATVRRGRVVAILTSPFRMVAAVWRAWRDRGHYVALLNSDDRLLGDIGLTRADLHVMIAEPWLRGEKHAAERAAERRAAEKRLARHNIIDPGNFV
jgi:uncharacterized protein YjiS (DUF1127 family)